MVSKKTITRLLQDDANGQLTSFGIVGSIIPQSSDLFSLEYQDLSTNYLTDELPRSLEKLTRLKHLSLLITPLKILSFRVGKLEEYDVYVKA
ncbi:hypothetical protein GQ457_09G015010 [Hibiscus cannabinus]